MQDFAAKQNALFACLDDASKELKGTTLDQSRTNALKSKALKRLSAEDDGEMVYRFGANKRLSASPDKSLTRMRGKESIFKKPELPIAQCLKPRKVPDYEVNPHKWKKYSLSDVDISDRTNTSAAYEFLKQIDEQREAECGGGDKPFAEGEREMKIEFRKSSKIRRNLRAIEAEEVADAEVDSPKLKGSKLVMPEYVIGQRVAKSKKPKEASAKNVERAAGTLLLEHLLAEDDQDEDDQDNGNATAPNE